MRVESSGPKASFPCEMVYPPLPWLQSNRIRAFPPLELLGGRLLTPEGLYTGRLAVWWGVLIMLAALGAGALWGMGAYAFLNPDILTVLIPCIIVGTVGFAIAAGWLLRQGR